jgi:hypothetical protein
VGAAERRLGCGGKGWGRGVWFIEFKARLNIQGVLDRSAGERVG